MAEADIFGKALLPTRVGKGKKVSPHHLPLSETKLLEKAGKTDGK